MKTKAILLLCVSIALTACEPAPDFFDTDGNGYSYEALQGNWLVINYWATWCAPCISEIPELIALGENHDNIMVFGVNFDAPAPAEMQQQIAKMKITFPVYQSDPYLQIGIEKPEVLPTTVLINPAGEVSDVLVGPQTEESLIQALNSGAVSDH